MLKTVNIFTCDICGKELTIEQNHLPDDMLNTLELEESIFGQAHTTKWNHVCKNCVSEIRKTIKKLGEVEDGQS